MSGAAEDPCAPSAELLQLTEAALLSASSADNAERARAEAFLRPLLRRRGAGAALLALHTGSAHAVVRQLAGVLLRPKALAEYNRTLLSRAFASRFDGAGNARAASAAAAATALARGLFALATNSSTACV